MVLHHPSPASKMGDRLMKKSWINAIKCAQMRCICGDYSLDHSIDKMEIRC